MSARRRAAVLGGLALLLGSLAASDIAGREADLRRRLGPVVAVVAARRAIPRGAVVDREALAVRRVPARYAPAGAFRSPAEVAGARAAVTIAAGADLQAGLLAGGEDPAGAPLLGARADERVARIVAVGDARELPAGGRADVLITRDGAGGTPHTSLALRGARVVSSAPAPAAQEGAGAGLPRVSLGLLVTVPQAIALVEAQNGARELRALPRPDG